MNHIADANKMVGEDVSNEQMTAQATPNEELRRQILSHVVPKNEREWWAARAIERLEFELNAANVRIKRLEEAGMWQPIETAPTDMTWVIGYDAKDGEVGTIIFDLTGDVNDEDIHYEWTDGMRTWHPTHWMPLPEPPKAKEAKP